MNGKCNIWFKPAKIICTKYLNNIGKEKQSILLSGCWGISRHFHYVPEILTSLFWIIPIHFISILPYFYIIFLIILLFDRSNRDDQRCLIKYGKYWIKYRQNVKYKIIPYLF